MRRRLRRLLPLAAIACLGTACSSPPATPLAVMSFNIRYGTAEDGDDHWRNRADLVAETIRAAAPDVIGLQEALRFQLDELGAALPAYRELGVGRDDGREAGEYAAILYRAERLRPVAHGTFWLSDTPDVPGSTSWGNHITRICTWVRFEDLQSGHQFVMYNVHFDHESQPSRVESARLVLQRARAGPPLPAIVLGDFNAGEDNPARTLFLDTALAPGQVHFVDTYRVMHQRSNGEGTFNGFRGEVTGERIDAILVTPSWRVRSADILHTERNGRYPSDHFPVTALLEPIADEP